MSDKALRNAEAQRDALAAKINSAQQSIEEWKRELNRTDAFIAEWMRFAGGASNSDVDEESIQQSIPVAVPIIEPTGVRTKRSTGNSKKEDVAEAARLLIELQGSPMQPNDLFEALISNGYVITGTDPKGVLTTMLWRMRRRVTRVKGGGYWPTEVPNPEFGYDPATNSDVDQFLRAPAGLGEALVNNVDGEDGGNPSGLLLRGR